MPVVLYIHDEPESHLFANSFSEFLIRGVLRSFSVEGAGDGASGGVGAAGVWRRHVEIIGPFLDPAHLRTLKEMGDPPSSSECAAADRRIAELLPIRKIIGSQPPVRYDEDLISDRPTLLRLYGESVSYYRNLVVHEGMEEFRPKLDQAEAACARVLRGES
ncbi:hypothetical protein AMK27_36500 [Streptomyces sp. CB02009]|uniref:hypothetical protein n=1 Tax=Streptomyces sp. CB02009 TaxID=1703938 RepID=UPI00093B6802|nr:hypothetical protein [Streptomyces sp. CB02009]OKJ49550.1 hypothetical protein AMK27_36500 [Streptomyces sp. CB02009]